MTYDEYERRKLRGPRAMPAEVFQAALRAAGEHVPIDSPAFPQALREEAALLGWVQLDESDPKTWVKVIDGLLPSVVPKA